MSDRLRGYGFVVAALLWVTMGLFYKALVATGLPPLTVVFFRAAVAAAILFAILGVRRRGLGWSGEIFSSWPAGCSALQPSSSSTSTPWNWPGWGSRRC